MSAEPLHAVLPVGPTSGAPPGDVEPVAVPLPAEATVRRRAFAKFRRRPAAVTGLAVVTLFAAVALAAPLLAPYDPDATSWAAVRKAPRS